MLKYIVLFSACMYLSCGSSSVSEKDYFKRKYSLSNDSLEQVLEIFSMNDSLTQFTLRVENKYQDTLDSYMSNAISSDRIHLFTTAQAVPSALNCLLQPEILLYLRTATALN
jgi:hypothetical protein